MSNAIDQPVRRPIVPFTHRVVAALFLRPAHYAYAASDPGALSQAIAVVCFSGFVQPSVITRELGTWGMLISLFFALLRWLLFSTAIVYPTARILAAKPIDYRRLLSCLGFAEAPALLNALAFLIDKPLPSAEPTGISLWLPSVVSTGIWLWLLAANVVAVRAAAGVSWRRASIIGVTSFALYLVVGMASDLLLMAPP